MVPEFPCKTSASSRKSKSVSTPNIAPAVSIWKFGRDYVKNRHFNFLLGPLPLTEFFSQHIINIDVHEEQR